MVGSRLRCAATLHYSVLEKEKGQLSGVKHLSIWRCGHDTERKYMPLCQLINLLFGFFPSFYF